MYTKKCLGYLIRTRIWIKPTGKRLVFTGVDIDKVIDGLIVEHGGAVNTFETLFEAGMIGAIWFLE